MFRLAAASFKGRPRHTPSCQLVKRQVAWSRLASNHASPRYATRPLAILGVLGSGALLVAYFAWPDASRSAPTYTDVALSPTHFTPVTVTSSMRCSDPDTMLMTLTVPRHLIPPSHGTAFSPVWSVFIKDDDIQVERPYTPLEGMDENGHMKFWIKRYPKGEVGRWLHSKTVSDKVEIRGPLKTWNWVEDAWDEVVMISGGTGITPFYQLLHSVLFNPSKAPTTRFTLLHSSRVPGELPPPELLHPLLKHARDNPDSLKLAFYVDSKDGSNAEAVSLTDIHERRIGRADVLRTLHPGHESSWWHKILRVIPTRSPTMTNRKILFLVCGPEPMISAIAGPYGRNYTQGPVGGILGDLGCERGQVWKL